MRAVFSSGFLESVNCTNGSNNFRQPKDIKILSFALIDIFPHLRNQEVTTQGKLSSQKYNHGKVTDLLSHFLVENGGGSSL